MVRRLNFVLILIFNVFSGFVTQWTNMNEKCPNVKAMRNFDLEQMMGFWYVVQYYASSEEVPEYACMRNNFFTEDQRITMNFTYIYAVDPLRENIHGNITWVIPDFRIPAHWMHVEDIYEGIYNTYVLDTEYQSWALLMHCAEKKNEPRYLSALMLARAPSLEQNVINYLKEKLQRYEMDLTFMFPLEQTRCDHLMESSSDDPRAYILRNHENDTEIIKVLLNEQ